MGDDRRRTSLKLTEESFEYLEEEQENRAVSTRQDTVEAVIQEHMELTADDNGVRNVREWWKDDLRENAGTYGLIGAAVAALSGGNLVALLLAAVIISVAAAGLYLEYEAFTTTREEDDDDQGGGDTPATEPAAD